MAKILLRLIAGYQKWLSPDHGKFKVFYPYGYCKYYPTCSEYSKQSIIKYGALIGIGRSIIRIIKCNPLSKGGIDLP